MSPVTFGPTVIPSERVQSLECRVAMLEQQGFL